MASLPIILPNGMIAVYGTGTSVSPSGIGNIEPNGVLRWGNIYQIWDGGASFIYGGDNVMFKESDVYCRVAYDNTPYTIIPAKLVTKQEPLL